jgi:hypothetical protein
MATGSVRSADAGRSWQPLDVGWPAGYGTTRAGRCARRRGTERPTGRRAPRRRRRAYVVAMRDGLRRARVHCQAPVAAVRREGQGYPDSNTAAPASPSTGTGA